MKIQNYFAPLLLRHIFIWVFWATILSVFVIPFGIQTTVCAQNIDGSGLKNPTKWSTRFDKITGLKIGDIVTLYMETPIENGYHIYSVKVPTKKIEPMPTFFTLEKESKDAIANGNCIDGIIPEKYYDDVFENDLYYFKNKVIFKQKIKITGNNPRIVGALKYQYCTDEVCDYGTLEIDKSIKLFHQN